MIALWVTLAGAGGVLARYGIATAAGPGAGLWAIGAINVAGSFLLGVLTATQWFSRDVRDGIGVGFLGGFTTFSTFSVQVVVDVEAGELRRAGLYLAASVLGGIAAAACGLALGRAVR